MIAQSAAEQMGLVIGTTQHERVRGIGGLSVPVGQCTVVVEIDGLVDESVVLVVLKDQALMSEIILVGEDLLGRRELVTVVHEGCAPILSADAHPEKICLRQYRPELISLLNGMFVSLPEAYVLLLLNRQILQAELF